LSEEPEEEEKRKILKKVCFFEENPTNGFFLSDFEKLLESVFAFGRAFCSLKKCQGEKEQVGTESLYFCTDPWALRHRFINEETGEMIRARCDRWNCLYCGPRKTDQWRQLIAAAEPMLHVVLSRAGNTVEEAARALTTWVQFMRRGSKGRGRGHIGVRPGFPIEYFAVLERHEKFEETGFHWHVLVKGVDYIPKDILDASWASATHGKNEFAWVDRVNNARAIGYVTKYLTKDIACSEKGVKEHHREVLEMGVDPDGNLVEQTQTVVEEVVSHARRIRYSRHFFPEAVEGLRFRLFSKLDDPEDLERDIEPVNGETAVCQGDMSDEYAIAQEQGPQEEENKRPRWSLYEAEPFTQDIQEYRQRRRRALLESLMVVRAGEWFISGRVLSVWSFQRSQRSQRQEKYFVNPEASA
jgi:hypothetical protein